MQIIRKAMNYWISGLLKQIKAIRYPGYELELDVYKSSGNEYEQSEISEEEFLK